MIDDPLTQKTIGAAMAVHSSLGPGFLESVYHKAMLIELAGRGIKVESQKALPVFYKGEIVGDFFVDIEAEGILLELKATQEHHEIHEAQLVNYLKATNLEVGLLLNFGMPSLLVKRKFKDCKSASHSVHSVPNKNPVPPAHPANPVKTSAFTLLELLVAMAVLAILVVMMMGLVTSATSLWRQSENRADAYREARAALTIISRDLANLVVSTNTNYFLINDKGAFAKVPAGAETNAQRLGAAFFLSALPLNAQAPGSLSDVCEVGYFMGFERTFAGGNSSMQTLNLYRFFRSSNPTFTNLLGNSTFAGASFSSAESELLARNIREFRITPLIYTNDAYSTNFTPSTSKPVPDAVEISITAVNQEAARRFTNRTEWVNSSAPLSLTNAQQIFTTRIRLPQLAAP